MSAKRLLALAGVGLFLALLSGEALANHYTSRARARAEIRNDWDEIRRGRAELRREVDDFYESRADLNRAIRRGAPPHVIARQRAEVREDLNDVAEARRELRRDYRELDRDLDRGGWYRHPDGRWYRYPAYRSNSYNRDRYGWWPWNSWWR